MVAGLDSWQAMELDVALAVKFSTLEKEEQFSQLELILSSLDNVMRVQGAKIKKRKPQESLIKPYVTSEEIKAIDDLPLASDIISEITGGITVVNIEGILDGRSS